MPLNPFNACEQLEGVVGAEQAPVFFYMRGEYGALPYQPCVFAQEAHAYTAGEIQRVDDKAVVVSAGVQTAFEDPVAVEGVSIRAGAK